MCCALSGNPTNISSPSYAGCPYSFPCAVHLFELFLEIPMHVGDPLSLNFGW